MQIRIDLNIIYDLLRDGEFQILQSTDTIHMHCPMNANNLFLFDLDHPLSYMTM